MYSGHANNSLHNSTTENKLDTLLASVKYPPNALNSFLYTANSKLIAP